MSAPLTVLATRPCPGADLGGRCVPARPVLAGSTPHSQGRGHRRSRLAGFTLIEVMVAIVIFATGLLALALCVPMATKRVVKAGSQTRASSLASETAEELLTIPYGDGALTAGTHDDTANPHDGLYYVRWVVEDDAPSPNCKRVTVKVARGAANRPAEAQLVIVTALSGG